MPKVAVSFLQIINLLIRFFVLKFLCQILNTWPFHQWYISYRGDREIPRGPTATRRVLIGFFQAFKIINAIFFYIFIKNIFLPFIKFYFNLYILFVLVHANCIIKIKIKMLCYQSALSNVLFFLPHFLC